MKSSDITTPRKARMLETLSMFDFDIEHIPGQTNILGRRFIKTPRRIP